MTNAELLHRIQVDPQICGGKPVIRGTRTFVAIILDGMAEGLTPDQIIEHYPHLALEDIRAALAYAAVLAQENTWKIAG